MKTREGQSHQSECEVLYEELLLLFSVGKHRCVLGEFSLEVLELLPQKIKKMYSLLDCLTLIGLDLGPIDYLYQWSMGKV